MEKRLIFALTASIVIILVFQYFTAKPKIEPLTQPQAVVQEVPRQPIEPQTVVSSPIDVPKVSENLLYLQTDKFNFTFSNIGGALKGLCLRDFEEKGSTDCLELVDIADPRDYILNVSSSDIKNLDVAGYAVSQSAGSVQYSFIADDWEISKKYIISNSRRGIELELTVKNLTDVARQFSFNIVGGSGLTESSPHDRRMVGVSAKIDDKTYGYKAPKGKRITNRGKVVWAALTNKYFSLILKPMGLMVAEYYYENEAGELVMGMESGSFTVPANSVATRKFLLYAGPNQIQALKEFGHGIEESVSYGFFGAISKLLLVVLGFFYSLVHSWGIAIVLLAIFLNVLLFPLTQKSFKSMQKMQALHPQMEKLKKQHKDNPQKLNKEIMELYKKYKINPLSGCLPMLLQMPIFIALYQALIRSVDLRNAPFLWIRDLSSPDAVRLPFSLPVIGNSINILPLIMVGAMVLQQKMSSKSMGGAVTDEQKQQQKMMMLIMPVMFGFIFYNMPSGLVLYWVVNTTLTIAEQAAIMRRTVLEE